MTSISAGHGRSTTGRQVVGATVVAVLAALLWFAWLGWDNEYQVDPVTKVSSGPYEAWQVVGCALSLLAVFVCALLANIRPLWASVALTLAFTAAWTATAAAQDDSGLFLVGAVLVAGGLALATTVVSLLVQGVRGAVRSR